MKLKVFASWQADRADLEQIWTIFSLGYLSHLILISIHFSRVSCYPPVCSPLRQIGHSCQHLWNVEDLLGTALGKQGLSHLHNSPASQQSDFYFTDQKNLAESSHLA